MIKSKTLKQLSFLCVLFGAILFGTISSTPAVAQTDPTRSLYLIGDSWTAQMSDTYGSFEQALEDRNLTDSINLISYAESGSTAAGWATDDPCTPSCSGRFTTLKTAIANDPLPSPVLFFTLGGNDLLAGFAGGPNTAVYDQIKINLRTVISEVKAIRADVVIIIGGYDILNPAVDEIRCPQLLTFVFGSTDPAVSNPYQILLQDAITELAGEFTAVEAINTYGSLQSTPGNPDITTWSDVQYVQDCIHLNGEGYAIYLNTVFSTGLEEALTKEAVVLTSSIYLPVVR